uniref:Putative secreted protein n=1 Tax=Ixodes ricinus TaxID=34613 RepID=A0A6B0U8W0_IXORI
MALLQTWRRLCLYFCVLCICKICSSFRRLCIGGYPVLSKLKLCWGEKCAALCATFLFLSKFIFLYTRKE